MFSIKVGIQIIYIQDMLSLYRFNFNSTTYKPMFYVGIFNFFNEKHL